MCSFSSSLLVLVALLLIACAARTLLSNQPKAAALPLKDVFNWKDAAKRRMARSKEKPDGYAFYFKRTLLEVPKSKFFVRCALFLHDAFMLF